MSVALIIVLAWLVVLPLAFLLVVAVHPRYLRWYVARPKHQVVSRVDLSTAVARRKAGPRPTWR